jgi:hypothetical protein
MNTHNDPLEGAIVYFTLTAITAGNLSWEFEEPKIDKKL